MTGPILLAGADTDVPAVNRGPVPAWVEPQVWSTPTVAPAAGFPAELILSDSQDRLGDESSDYYFHTVVRLLNGEGVRQNAEQTVVYSPDYQAVTWHTLQIVRGTQMIDLLPSVKFKRLQRELGFEAKIYDGQVSAIAVLEDVRMGDVLECAYTLHDANPLMRGQQSARHYLGAGYPVRRQSVIVRLAATAPPLSRYYWVPPDTLDLPEPLFRLSRLRSALREEVVGDERVYRWEAKDIAPIVFDQAIPPQASPYYPMVRFSSFDSWSRVVDWAEPLFSGCGPLPDEAVGLVEKWKDEYPDPEPRLRAAVDWVQGDIRYFAMAMGNHNIRPRPLRDIGATRFGDCKDKSVMLVALLRSLGIEAWPALVNSYTQDKVQTGGPDQYAFNHAIVAYVLRGQLRWIDPTIKQPAGSAGGWMVPPYRLGLILRPNESSLTPIPLAPKPEPDTETLDLVTIDPDSGAAELTTKVIVRGLEADFYRQFLESVSSEEISKRWFNFIGRFYRRLQELTPPVIEDDRAANQLTIGARYRLPDFLKTETGQTGFGIYAYALRALLDPPESRRRHWPYAQPINRFIRHRIEVGLPFSVSADQRPQVIQLGGLEYAAEKSLAGKRFVAVHNLRFSRDLVPAAEMEAYADAVDEILADLGTTIFKPLGATTTQPPKGVSSN